MNSLYKSPPGATNPRRETERERERERSPRCCGWFPSIISTPQQSATRLPLIHHASIVARQVRRRTTPSSMSPFFLRGFNSQLATSISSTSCQPPVRETKESKGIPQINHPARPRASCFVLRASCFVLRASCFVLRASCFVSEMSTERNKNARTHREPLEHVLLPRCRYLLALNALFPSPQRDLPFHRVHPPPCPPHHVQVPREPRDGPECDGLCHAATIPVALAAKVRSSASACSCRSAGGGTVRYSRSGVTRSPARVRSTSW